MINNKNKGRQKIYSKRERDTRGFSRKLYAACVIYFHFSTYICHTQDKFYQT